MDGYPLSDGDWPTDERCVPKCSRFSSRATLYLCGFLSATACLRPSPQRVTRSWWSGPRRVCSEPSRTCSGPGESFRKQPEYERLSFCSRSTFPPPTTHHLTFPNTGCSVQQKGEARSTKNGDHHPVREHPLPRHSQLRGHAERHPPWDGGRRRAPAGVYRSQARATRCCCRRRHRHHCDARGFLCVHQRRVLPESHRAHRKRGRHATQRGDLHSLQQPT